MPRADKRYTAGLMQRLERTVANTPGRHWHLEQGSTTYGRWWRVCEVADDTGAHYEDLVSGRTEYDVQHAFGAFLDGYSAGYQQGRVDS